VWRQKLDRGRAHFRQMSAAMSSAARTFDTLKVLLEEIETEWADTPKTSAMHYVSGNHRSATNSAENRTASAESSDEWRKLPPGERRILTALAQYPEGRSKAQVAILAGYALNGGGFNNYLGALPSDREASLKVMEID
jgi:hypothetical protein